MSCNAIELLCFRAEILVLRRMVLSKLSAMSLHWSWHTILGQILGQYWDNTGKILGKIPGNLEVLQLLFFKLYSMVYFGIASLWVLQVLLSRPCSTMNPIPCIELLYQGSSSEASRTWALFLRPAVKEKKLWSRAPLLETASN